jgi:flagellar protein FliO/FliZ
MNAAPDMIAAGLKMIAALGIVLAMILALLYGMRKLTAQRLGASSGRNIQVLESHYMGVKKAISLVRVPGKVLVLGVTGDRINLLDTLDDDFIDEPLSGGQAKSFGPMLSERLKKIGQGRKARKDG